MAAHRTAIIGNAEAKTLRDVLVVEKTIGAVRDRAAAYEEGREPFDLVGGVIWDDCNISDLAWQCDIPVAELEAYPPSELENLVIVCREINPHFFRHRRELADLFRRLKAAVSQKQSTAPVSG